MTNESDQSSFVYVTFIRTTAEKLWSALTMPNQMKEYWFGMQIKTQWKAGAEWQMLFPDGRVADTGEILECRAAKADSAEMAQRVQAGIEGRGFCFCTDRIEPSARRAAYDHAYDRARGIEVHSGGFRRVAKGPFESQISARNRPNCPDGSRPFSCAVNPLKGGTFSGRAFERCGESFRIE